MIGFIIWYLIGLISIIIWIKIVEKVNISVKDIIPLLLLRFLGPLITFVLIMYLIDKYRL